jgi:hypothetical protein
MAGQADFPYVPQPGSLQKLLEKLPTVGTPTKADGQWLTGLGFGGGNNRMILPLMKEIGILDASGGPTELYAAFRSKNRAAVAAGVRRSYSALFSMYPDAHRQDDEALMAFARSRTDYAAGTQRLAVRTFKAFATFGDFDADGAEDESDDEVGAKDGGGRKQTRRAVPTSSGVGLTVNLQLQLPPSTDGEIYDKLFAAMAKHLKGLLTLE